MGKEMASTSTVLAVKLLGKDGNRGRKLDSSTLTKDEVCELNVHRGHTLSGHFHRGSFINLYFHWEHMDLCFAVLLRSLD